MELTAYLGRQLNNRLLQYNVVNVWQRGGVGKGQRKGTQPDLVVREGDRRQGIV